MCGVGQKGLHIFGKQLSTLSSAAPVYATVTKGLGLEFE